MTSQGNRWRAGQNPRGGHTKEPLTCTSPFQGHVLGHSLMCHFLKGVLNCKPQVPQNITQPCVAPLWQPSDFQSSSVCSVTCDEECPTPGCLAQLLPHMALNKPSSTNFSMSPLSVPPHIHTDTLSSSKSLSAIKSPLRHRGFQGVSQLGRTFQMCNHRCSEILESALGCWSRVFRPLRVG